MESETHQDYISQLPDPILHKILSRAFCYKDTIDLIRTCILLSKRWTNLWASFPHLRLSDHRFPHVDYKSNPAFPRFINSVLLNRDGSDVESFFLWRGMTAGLCMPHHLATWLQYAVDHNVRNLHVMVDLNEAMFKLPRSVLACRSLEKLDLGISGHGEDGVGYVDLPEFAQLGRLRELRLAHFNIVPDALESLISGCPLLEDMTLYECMIQDPDICSDSLKKLNVGLCKINGLLVRISGANLQYLTMAGNDIDRLEVLLEGLPSLAKAYVQTDDYCGDYFGDITAELLEYVSPWSEGLSERELLELEIFHNLKKLELDGQLIIENLPTVAHFLERSPNLEVVKLGQQVLINRDPIHKKLQMKNLFNCPHLEDILAAFDEKNGSLSELLSDFCYNKCSCFQE